MKNMDKTARLLADYSAKKIDRRTFLRSVVTAGLTSAAAYELLLSAKPAAAQSDRPTLTTLAIGEEGSSVPKPAPQPPQITTFAIGEEGAEQPFPQPIPQPEPPRATTRRFGEENAGGGKFHYHRHGDHYHGHAHPVRDHWKGWSEW